MARIYPELLLQFNTFFQLGLGDQPKGYMGDLKNLNIWRNAQLLIHILDRLFGEAEMKVKLSGFRQRAYANALFALGTLSYGARAFKQARSFLRSAVAADSRVLFDPGLLSMFTKSLLGVRLSDWLKKKKQQIMPGHRPAFSSRVA